MRRRERTEYSPRRVPNALTPEELAQRIAEQNASTRLKGSDEPADEEAGSPAAEDDEETGSPTAEDEATA